MSSMEALTKLVVGMSRLGDHLLKHKVSGTVVAALAFACGAGLAGVFRHEATPPPPVVAEAQAADPPRAEVVMRDTSKDEEEGSAVFDKGVYENYVYGYSVRIPRGMIGLGSRPPAPQHGFVIDLDRPRSTAWPDPDNYPKSYLDVDGSYNSLEWKRPGDAVKSHLSYLRQKGRDVRVQLDERTTLGGLPAAHVVARYAEGGAEMLSEVVIAFRAGDDRIASPVYTLELNTPAAKYERDRPAFEEVWQSWSLQPAE